MVVNNEQLIPWKEYKYPDGIKVGGDEEFHNLIKQKAVKIGIPCNITVDNISIGAITAMLGIAPGTCVRISEREPKQPKGVLRTALRQAFSSTYGDFVIMFSQTGTYSFMEVYKSVSGGSVLDMLSKLDSDGKPRLPDETRWSQIMGDIIQQVADEIR